MENNLMKIGLSTGLIGLILMISNLYFNNDIYNLIITIIISLGSLLMLGGLIKSFSIKDKTLRNNEIKRYLILLFFFCFTYLFLYGLYNY